MLHRILPIYGVCVGFLSPVLAAEQKLDNQGCYATTSHIIQQGDSFTAGSFENVNVRLPDQYDSAAFPMLSGRCIGAFTVVSGEVDVNGSCEFGEAAGNKFVVVFARKGDPQKVAGTWRFVGGTGKYADISGQGKFKAIGELPTPGMANWAGGCDHVWGTYIAPGIK